MEWSSSPLKVLRWSWPTGGFFTVVTEHQGAHGAQHGSYFLILFLKVEIDKFPQSEDTWSPDAGGTSVMLPAVSSFNKHISLYLSKTWDGWTIRAKDVCPSRLTARLPAASGSGYVVWLCKCGTKNSRFNSWLSCMSLYVLISSGPHRRPIMGVLWGRCPGEYQYLKGLVITMMTAQPSLSKCLLKTPHVTLLHSVVLGFESRTTGMPGMHSPLSHTVSSVLFLCWLTKNGYPHWFLWVVVLPELPCTKQGSASYKCERAFRGQSPHALYVHCLPLDPSNFTIRSTVRFPWYENLENDHQPSSVRGCLP